MADALPDVYLRFQGLKGECMDETHPGEFKPGSPRKDKNNKTIKDGWIEITEFSFGFGSNKDTNKTTPSEARKRELIKKGIKADEAARIAKAEADAADAKTQTTEPRSWGTSGPLNFEKFKFSKNTDFMSYRLMQKCHTGERIPSVELVMCRPGGDTAEKIEFLSLVFENVFLKSCDLNLGEDGLPTEDIEFEYDTVIMRTTWTDNAIGNRRPEQPLRVGWDVREAVQIARGKDFLGFDE